MKTRQQQYAALIYNKVHDYQKIRFQANPAAQNDPKKDKQLKAYGSMAHQLPVVIRTAGLTQALAFLVTRKEDAQKKQLYNDLVEVVKQVSGLDLETHRDVEIQQYMRLTDEALTALLWFKRYAQSILEVDASDSGGEP